MPSSIHDIFTELVVEEIKSQLNSAHQGKEGNGATILSQIGSETTSDIYLYGFDAVNGEIPQTLTRRVTRACRCAIPFHRYRDLILSNAEEPGSFGG
jgi:hypothetical protein